MSALSGKPSEDFWNSAKDDSYRVADSVQEELVRADYFLPMSTPDTYAKIFRIIGVEHGELLPENQGRWRIRISIRKKDVSYCITTVRPTIKGCFRHATLWMLHL